MLQPQIQRLRHFLFTAPVTLREVTECVNLAMERSIEISMTYDGRLEEMTTQAKGELNLLKELAESAFCAGENLLVLRQNANRCEAAIQSALDVAALGTDRITVH